MIVIDIHEPDALKKIADKVDDIKVDVLVTGEKTYAIERKTVSDFAKSVYQGRLFDQCFRLKDVGIPILIIEGDFRSLKFTKFSRELYFGTVTALIECGIGVVTTYNINDTIKYLQVLNKRCGKKPSKIVKPKVKAKKPIDVVAAIPYVGTKTAETLLKEYKVPAKIFTLSREEWINILGEKRGTFVYKLLNGEDDEDSTKS